MKPQCETEYQFIDKDNAPTWLGTQKFVVRSVSRKSKLFDDNEYNLIVFANNQSWVLNVTENAWNSYVRPASWIINSDYFVVGQAGQELAHREYPSLGKQISIKRSMPMWVEVIKAADGFVQFTLDGRYGIHRREHKMSVHLFHGIFQKAPRASLEGYIMRKNDIYQYGKPCNLNEMKHLSMKPIGVTPADFKRALAEVHPMKTSVHVEFDFKTDEDRLKAIEFLQKMKVQ